MALCRDRVRELAIRPLMHADDRVVRVGLAGVIITGLVIWEATCRCGSAWLATRWSTVIVGPNGLRLLRAGPGAKS